MAKPTPHLEKGLKAMERLIRLANKEESKRLIPILRKVVMESANELEHCPFCSQPIKDTTVTFTQETAKDAIRIILNWCNEKGRVEFKTSEIKHLLTHTQYANLNHLVSFGGIIYRPINRKTGKRYSSTYYGINRARADEFLRGEKLIPTQITRDRFTRERTGEAEGTADDLPHTNDLLDESGRYTQPAIARPYADN